MRGKPAKKREIKPDPKYGNAMLGKFINYVMERGKKTVAQGIVYGALDRIAAESKKDPVKVFEEAIKNVQPQVEVRTRRVGCANYQVPMPVSFARQNALTFRW